MAQYEWSEVFMSIEGEARYAGHPTVYIRFARCNFKCPKFNNQFSNCPTCGGNGKINLHETDPYQFDGDICPECEGRTTVQKPSIGTNGYATLNFNPKHYKTLQEIPLIHKGCDSQYAVNPEFAHMWHKGDEKELAAEVLKVLPHNTFQNPETGKRVILSLTGGEPTIRLKFWVPLLDELYKHGMRTVLIETNCAAPMRQKDLDALTYWATTRTTPDRTQYDCPKLVWSNSPKLAISGELWDKAIRPEIAMQQIKYIKPDSKFVLCEQYFKFVCGPTNEDFDEVAKAMNAYYEAGIPRTTDVYIMPVACTEEQQQEISAQVAHMCITKGYIYCHRIQNSVFGNGVGT
jgi:organic radical activating enzyme